MVHLPFYDWSTSSESLRLIDGAPGAHVAVVVVEAGAVAAAWPVVLVVPGAVVHVVAWLVVAWAVVPWLVVAWAVVARAALEPAATVAATLVRAAAVATIPASTVATTITAAAVAALLDKKIWDKLLS